MKTFTSRFIITITTLALILLVAGSVMAQDTNISSACRNVDGRENSVVRIGVPEDAVGGGGVFCRVVHDGSGYVLSPATIGNLGVIQRGVLASVDVFGQAGAAAVNNFAQEIQICLRGTGTFIFMNQNFTPRIPAEMPAFTRQLEDGTYTCSFIASSGLAVLVNGPTAPEASPEQILGVNVETVEVTNPDGTTSTAIVPSEVTTDTGAVGATPLTGCRVTTTAMVRMREQPNTTSEVITRLPYQINLQATAETDGWVRVIYEDGQGWVSDRYVNRSAGCFN